MAEMEILDGRNYEEQVKMMLAEYNHRLNRDLSFQNIGDELEQPLKKYTAPDGELLVAVNGDKVCGMVAYHRLSDSRCEMKRLFVYPEYRSNYLGNKLIYAIVQHAKSAGYDEMVLDTIKPLKTAIFLYKKFGFEECEPYYFNPMNDVIYMKKTL